MTRNGLEFQMNHAMSGETPLSELNVCPILQFVGVSIGILVRGVPLC
jgi:hypothetical protein